MSEQKRAVWPQEIIQRDALLIKKAAQDTAHKILQQRPALDEEIADQSEAKPLYVMAGEVHSNPAHKLFHLLVIQALQNSGNNILVGLEGPYNATEAAFARMFERDMDEKTAAAIREYDINGVLSLISDLGFMREKYAFYSGYIVKNYILRHHESEKLSTAHVDAKANGGFLDIKDAFTKAAFGDNRLMQDIHFASGLGMQVRNRHMADMLIDKAESRKADIVYHKTGISHLFGTALWNAKPYAQKHGLAAYFKRQARSVMAIPLQSGNHALKELPWRLRIDDERLVMVESLPTYLAYDGDDPEIVDHYKIDMPTIESEAAYVSAILTEWGQDDLIIAPDGLGTHQDKISYKLAPLYKHWAKKLYGLHIG